MRSGVQTAVHIQPRTGDLSGGRAGEEGDRRRDIFRLSVMTDGNHLTLGFCLFAVLRVHIAVGWAGMHQVHGNTAGPQIRARPRVKELSADLVME